MTNKPERLRGQVPTNAMDRLRAAWERDARIGDRTACYSAEFVEGLKQAVRDVLDEPEPATYSLDLRDAGRERDAWKARAEQAEKASAEWESACSEMLDMHRRAFAHIRRLQDMLQEEQPDANEEPSNCRPV